jgi:hypothetical protein
MFSIQFTYQIPSIKFKMESDKETQVRVEHILDNNNY